MEFFKTVGGAKTIIIEVFKFDFMILKKLRLYFIGIVI